ncbi:class II aldolase/adducin family protein [Rhizobium sp.]
MASFLTERQAVADICRKLSDHGFLAGTGGNVGLRLDDRLFAVTPTATDYATMRAEDVVVLRLDTLEQIEGDKKPSVEKGLHQRMLQAWPERRASIHTHQPIASAVALLHETIAWPVSSAGDLGRQIGLIPYRPSGTGMLVKALGKALKPDVHAYLLASHGVICTVKSLDDAVDMVRRIEAAAALHLQARIQRNGSTDSAVRQMIATTLAKAATQGA